MENRQLCPKCGGIGVVYHVEKITDGYRGEVDTCPVCRGTGSVPVAITNADRIRRMSDVELAELLEHVHRNPCTACCGNTYWCRRNNAPEPDCKKHFVEWLKAPAEEDT